MLKYTKGNNICCLECHPDLVQGEQHYKKKNSRLSFTNTLLISLLNSSAYINISANEFNRFIGRWWMVSAKFEVGSKITLSNFSLSWFFYLYKCFLILVTATVLKKWLNSEKWTKRIDFFFVFLYPFLSKTDFPFSFMFVLKKYVLMVIMQ